jgi:hypothetical protein
MAFNDKVQVFSPVKLLTKVRDHHSVFLGLECYVQQKHSLKMALMAYNTQVGPVSRQLDLWNGKSLPMKLDIVPTQTPLINIRFWSYS